MFSDKNTCETRQTSIYNSCNLPIQTNITLEQTCKEPKLLHLPPKICFLKQTVQDPTLSIYLKLELTSEVKNYSVNKLSVFIYPALISLRVISTVCFEWILR